MQGAVSGQSVPASPEPNRLRSVWLVVTHVRVGVGLLVLALAGSVAGVLVRQGQTCAYYHSVHSDAWARWVLRLHLDDVYHSTWFNAVLALLAVVLGCCTLRRFRWRLHHLGFLLSHLSVIMILLAGLLYSHHGVAGILAEPLASDDDVRLDEAPLVRFSAGQGGRYVCRVRRSSDRARSVTALLRLPFETRIRRVETSLYPPVLYVVDGSDRRVVKHSVQRGLVWRPKLGHGCTIRVTRYLPDYRWDLIETAGSERPELLDPAIVVQWRVDGVEQRRLRLYARDQAGCQYIGRNLWQVRHVRLSTGTDNALDQWVAAQRRRDAERLIVTVGTGLHASRHEQLTQWPEPERLPRTVKPGPDDVTLQVEAFYPAYDPTRVTQDLELLPSRPAIAVALVRGQDVDRRVVVANTDACFRAKGVGDKALPAVTIRYERPVQYRVYLVQRLGHKTLHVVAFCHQFLTAIEELLPGQSVDLDMPGLRAVRLGVPKVLSHPRLVETSRSDEPRRPLVGLTVEAGEHSVHHQAVVTDDAEAVLRVPGTPLLVQLAPPDPRVREYRTTVEFRNTDTQQVEHAATIRVNHPAYHRGYGFYQWEHKRYTRRDGSEIELVGLQVVWNPAVWLACVGLGLLAIGVTYSVYLQAPLARWEARRRQVPRPASDEPTTNGSTSNGTAAEDASSD